MKKYIKMGIFLLVLGIFQYKFTQETFARSGCCSHHGGVCGCGCCDGSALSATCAPYYPCGNNAQPVEEPVEIVKPTTVPTRIPIPTLVPTKRPVPTVRPTTVPTVKSTIVPTLTPTIVPTLVVTKTVESTPTVIVTMAPSKINEVKPIVHQSIFSRFFRWLVGKK